jgi:hypothetical protein
MANNFAPDVSLPGSSRPALPFLMDPQAETAEAASIVSTLTSFVTRITAREIAGP